MIMTDPQVTVILPYFEGQSYLSKAVESVSAQQGLSWELIVVDDGSSAPPDPILDAFPDPRIRLLRIPHAGKGAALNRGAESARAGVICFLDQDDLMKPDRLLNQYCASARVSGADVIYSDYERLQDNGDPIDAFISRPATNREHLHRLAVGESLVTMQTFMIRKETFRTMGGFSEDILLTGLDDAEFMARLFASNALLHYEPGIVQAWVRHDRNYMRSDQFQKARLVLLEHLSRLSARYPVIREELPFFRYHAFNARGLYYLENGRAEEAVPEFLQALKYRPIQLNGYYLLFKSLFRHWGHRLSH